MGSPTCPTCGSKPGYRSGPHCLGSYPDPWHDTHRTPTPPAPADDASGAEAMRERAAKVAETHYLQPCPTLCGQSIATAIRALPLPPATGDATRVPARDDAVEEARDAVALLADARKCVALVNTNGYYDVWLARCDRVMADALRREGPTPPKPPMILGPTKWQPCKTPGCHMGWWGSTPFVCPIHKE